MTPRYETKKTREAEEQARIAVEESLPGGWEVLKADDAEHYDWVFMHEGKPRGLGEYKGRPTCRHDEFKPFGGVVFSTFKAQQLQMAGERYGVWVRIFWGFSDGIFSASLTGITMICHKGTIGRKYPRNGAPRDTEECYFIPSRLMKSLGPE